MKMHSVLFAAAAIGASALTVTLAAGPAQAAENEVVVTGRPADVPTALVRYGDLDLASEQGKARLAFRIDYAADKLCGKPRVIENHLLSDMKVCRSTVFASAKPQVEALYAAIDSGQRLALGDVGAMTVSAK